jgi:hypothetical protein
MTLSKQDFLIRLKELRESLNDPWMMEPDSSYIASLLREARRKNLDIPEYPKYLSIGGDRWTDSKGLSKLGTAFIMWDNFFTGFKPRQILLEDGRGMSSSSKGFKELCQSLGVES